MFSSDLKQFVEEETIYIGKHLRQALTIMENEGKIQVDELKLDGSKRRRGSFPEDVRVNFGKWPMSF